MDGAALLEPESATAETWRNADSTTYGPARVHARQHSGRKKRRGSTTSPGLNDLGCIRFQSSFKHASKGGLPFLSRNFYPAHVVLPRCQSPSARNDRTCAGPIETTSRHIEATLPPCSGDAVLPP